MKKLLSLVLLGVFVVSMVASVVVSKAESKPLVGVCYVLCNRTTYQLTECCPYTKHGDDVVWHCKVIGWCYPD